MVNYLKGQHDQMSMGSIKSNADSIHIAEADAFNLIIFHFPT